jgi:hypothetical protein
MKVSNELERMWKEAVVAFKVLSRQLPGETERNHETPVRIVGLRDEICNPGPPEYEAGVLTTRPRRSVVLPVI